MNPFDRSTYTSTSLRSEQALPGNTRVGFDDPCWQLFRQGMPIANRWSYLDHAAIAPLPTVTVDAMHDWLEQAANDGDVHWPSWARQMEELRETAASIIGAGRDEVAIVPNTTSGINLVAQGFRWERGDNVVISEGEFPANAYPWFSLRERGVETRVVPRRQGHICLESINDACDQRTRIVSVSWVGYSTGKRIDPAAAAEVAHRNGALLFLDAIQGLGVFPLDVAASAIDFVSADGHKWMLGPEGAGMFYIRRELLDVLRVPSIGWRSVIEPFAPAREDMQLVPTAARFEGGTANQLGGIGLLHSLRWLQSFGLGPTDTALADRVLELSRRATTGLDSIGAVIHSSREADTSSGIVSFEIPGRESESLRGTLQNHGIIASSRDGLLRVALHAYNDDNDISRLIDTVSSATGSR